MSQNNTKPDAEVSTFLPNNNAFSDILKAEMDSSVLRETLQMNLDSKEDGKIVLLESANWDRAQGKLWSKCNPMTSLRLNSEHQLLLK